MSDHLESQHSSQNQPFSIVVKQECFWFLRTMTFILPIIILLFTFVGRVVPVEGPSMMPTLYDGDRMLVQSMFYTPKQGDVVVLTKKSFNQHSIVKRVIAVGGQTVKIDYNAHCVYVDGVALTEPYIKESMIDIYGSSGISEAKIPEGSIFVMGDNRNVSADSRDRDVGIIDARCVIGHVLCVIFPFSDFGAIAS